MKLRNLFIVILMIGMRSIASAQGEAKKTEELNKNAMDQKTSLTSPLLKKELPPSNPRSGKMVQKNDNLLVVDEPTVDTAHVNSENKEMEVWKPLPLNNPTYKQEGKMLSPVEKAVFIEEGVPKKKNETGSPK